MSLEGKSPEDIHALAALANSVGLNAKTRLRFQALVKEAHPDASTPELDAAYAMRELAQQQENTNAEFAQYKADQAASSRDMQEWADVVGGGHCRYEDLSSVRAFMEENGITSKLFGAKSWSQSKSIAEPSSSQSRVFDMPMTFVDRWKQGGSKGLNQMARDEAYTAQQDFRAGRVV